MSSVIRGDDNFDTENAVVEDASGNVGIGVTPESDIVAGRPHLRIGTTTTLSGSSNNDQTYLSNNAKQVTTSHTSGWKYIVSDYVSQYKQLDGSHYFNVAPSGTAGAAITWKTRLLLENDADGNLHFADYHYFKNEANSAFGPLYASAFNVVSDYRLKENVTPMTSATERVKLLKPCRFNYIQDSGFSLLPPDITVDGFIAHEVADVVPEAVARSKDAMKDEKYEVTPATETEEAVMGTRSVPDMQGIDQSKLVPLLTATIQELIARIEVLEGV